MLHDLLLGVWMMLKELMKMLMNCIHRTLHAFHVNSRGTRFQSRVFFMRPHDRARLETNAHRPTLLFLQWVV